MTAPLTALIGLLPADENGPFGEGHELLVAIGKNASIDAMPIFTQYMKGGSLQRMRSMCHVLRKVHPEWAIQLLSPLLDDQRESNGWTYALVRGQNQPRRTIRICDEAAETIAASDRLLPFVMEGEHDALDRQIKSMKTQIAKRPQ